MKFDLRTHLQKHLDEIKPIIEAFPWEDKQCYGNWLAQTYYFASHTTALLALATSRCPVGDKMQRHFASHLAEEVGHDKLLINDMKFLNFDFSKTKEFASTAALYQTQYYGIEHQSPFMFFGYMLMLEATAAQFGPLMNARSAKGHTARCTSFLKIHAEEDIDHAESDVEQINLLPEVILKYAVKGMEHTFERYKMMLLDCQDQEAIAKKSA